MSDLKKIDANIVTVRETGVAYNALIHDTAVMIMEHAIEHGDCSRAQHLVMAMPASMRRTSLIAWFTLFSPIVTKNADDWNARMQKPKTVTGKENPLYKPFNLDAAKAKPFYQIANENREQNFVPLSFDDLVKQAQQFAQRVVKQIEDGKVADADLPSAQALARTLEDLHFTRVVPEGEQKLEQPSDTGNAGADAVLTQLRADYKAMFNKKAYPGWTAEQITQKMAVEASKDAAGKLEPVAANG